MAQQEKLETTVKVIPVLLIAALLAACAAGPDYRRPASALPESWGAPAAEIENLDDWWRNFEDPVLVALIDASLEHNNDLKVAAANVEAAAAALQLARADYLPTVNAQVSGRRASASEAAALPMPATPYNEYSGGLAVNYEFDIWGRVRRANEAALAELQRDVAIRDGVRASIAANVARAYFQARALDRQIELFESLYRTRLDNQQLQKTRLDAGFISPYDYEQARSETLAVAAQLPALRAARRETLNALAVLRGASPAEMFAAWTAVDSSQASDVAELPLPPAVPMDLPSELLERRPDVRAAEQQLIAANARIGEAKALFFPQLSLTGLAGGVSTVFSNLFDAPARTWQASVALVQPLTDLNRVDARVGAAEARHDAASAAYAKTVQTAFRETLDALSGVTAARDVMQAQDERVAALENAYRVANARYQAGSIGYLELLDVERQLRAIEQEQVEARLALLHATVDLYRALGGGWQAASRTS